MTKKEIIIISLCIGCFSGTLALVEMYKNNILFTSDPIKEIIYVDRVVEKQGTKEIELNNLDIEISKQELFIKDWSDKLDFGRIILHCYFWNGDYYFKLKCKKGDKAAIATSVKIINKIEEEFDGYLYDYTAGYEPYLSSDELSTEDLYEVKNLIISKLK